MNGFSNEQLAALEKAIPLAMKEVIDKDPELFVAAMRSYSWWQRSYERARFEGLGICYSTHLSSDGKMPID